jgi:hypothetical protein
MSCIPHCRLAENRLGTMGFTARLRRKLISKLGPKGDSVKVALAACLRTETTLTVGWITERLAMGTCGYLNHLLHRRRKLGRQ